jgi:hypothetical protein
MGAGEAFCHRIQRDAGACVAQGVKDGAIGLAGSGGGNSKTVHNSLRNIWEFANSEPPEAFQRAMKSVMVVMVLVKFECLYRTAKPIGFPAINKGSLPAKL